MKEYQITAVKTVMYIETLFCLTIEKAVDSFNGFFILKVAQQPLQDFPRSEGNQNKGEDQYNNNY